MNNIDKRIRQMQKAVPDKPARAKACNELMELHGKINTGISNAASDIMSGVDIQEAVSKVAKEIIEETERVATMLMQGGTPWDNHLADARLIAAAPDLLQACKWALADHQPKLENLGAPCNCDRCLSLRNAIAKAEGK